MYALRFFEMSGLSNPATQLHVTDDLNPHTLTYSNTHVGNFYLYAHCNSELTAPRQLFLAAYWTYLLNLQLLSLYVDYLLISNLSVGLAVVTTDTT
jgi:uncharacterized membrane protein